MRPALALIALLLALAGRSAAAVEVVASIAPVHSLAARVMHGTGEPHLLLPPDASPHDYALRPSDAAALEGAELVIWIGPGIERWLEGPLQSLAPRAHAVRLDDVPGLIRLSLRAGADFGDHADSNSQDHSNDETDPHLWLDPENGKLWLDAIAGALAIVDPANAPLYQANAVAGRAEIDAAVAEIEAVLAPVHGRPFILYHDGLQYFERRFAIEAVGSIALGDGRSPGPARIAEIRSLIRETGAVCLFREPQFGARLADTVAEGTKIRVGVIDPLGANLLPGSGVYTGLLRGIAADLVDCLR